MAAEINKIWEKEQDVMKEADGFLKKCSRKAFLYFTGREPLTQDGFELCLEEMIGLDCNRLYRAFCLLHPDMLENFNCQAEEMEAKSREAALPEEVKEKMWGRILESIHHMEE